MSREIIITGISYDPHTASSAVAFTEFYIELSEETNEAVLKSRELEKMACTGWDRPA